MKTTTIEVPLYYQSLQIVVAPNLQLALNEMDIKEDAEDFESFLIPGRHKILLLIKPTAPSSVIAHESVHIVNQIFKSAHIQLDIDNDEPQAYLMGWVVEQITKTIK